LAIDVHLYVMVGMNTPNITFLSRFPRRFPLENHERMLWFRNASMGIL
jgi:hypothetical protein